MRPVYAVTGGVSKFTKARQPVLTPNEYRTQEQNREAARERRKRYHERSASDQTLGMHGFAIMGGPESVPDEIFTDAHKERVLNG